MKQRVFGRLGEIPAIGLGTWKMERDADADVERAVHRAIDLGMTHVDTAEMYGDGVVEERIGRALAGKRDRVFLVSKVLPDNASREGTIAACEKSLQRLGTDRLDCYLLHWRGKWRMADTFAAFDQLEKAGKIRGWGVSNFDHEELDRALAIVGPDRIACNQVYYALGERTIEHHVVPWCERNRVAVVAYSPFGSGRFPAASSPGGKVLAEIAAAVKSTPHQVALAFLTRHKSVAAIPKAANVAHVADNAGAGDLRLSDDAIARINEAFPRARWRGLATI
jgi:diketogulonate reductase-like aldo/keto reductase